MSNSEVIKEFLVGLGFKVDPSSLSKFNGGVARATSSALQLGTAVTASAVAVETMVKRVSYQMENLYYASKMSGSSAEGLASLQYAFGQSGMSADQAAQAVKGLYMALATNPGTEGVLNSLGVKVMRDTKGNIKDLEKTTLDVVNKLSDLPDFVAFQYAGMLGIGPEEYMRMKAQRKEIEKDTADHAKRLHDAGLNQDDLDSKSQEFNTTLRRMEDNFGILGGKIADDVLPPLIKIVDWIDRAIVSFNNLGKGDTVLDHMANVVSNLSSETGGFSSLIGMTVLPMLGAWVLKTTLLKWIFGGLASAIGVTGEAAAATAGSAVVGETIGAAAGSTLIRTLLRSTALAPLLFFLDSTETGTGAGESTTGAGPGEGSLGTIMGPDGKSPTGSATPALSQPKPGKGDKAATAAYLMDKFKGLGWTHEQAAGLVGNAWAESNFDPSATNSIGMRGIFQWDHKRYAALESWAKASGKNANDIGTQAEFADYEMRQGTEQKAGRSLAQATTADEAGRAVGKNYERFEGGMNWFQAHNEYSKRAQFSEDFRKQTAGVTQTNTTNITINGSGNPQEVAARVRDCQKDVNAAAARQAGQINTTPLAVGG